MDVFDFTNHLYHALSKLTILPFPFMSNFNPAYTATSTSALIAMAWVNQSLVARFSPWMKSIERFQI
jgi:hypothetical protein